MKFRVSGVTEGGTDRVIVTLVLNESPTANGVPYANPGQSSVITLGLSYEEAAGYFPGKLFEVSLTSVEE